MWTGLHTRSPILKRSSSSLLADEALLKLAGPATYFSGLVHQERPSNHTIPSIIEPDLGNKLPSEWSNLKEQGLSALHLNMGCLFDPEDRFGPQRPDRPVTLDHAYWCQSRISSVFRDGLAGDPEQM